MSVSSLSAIEVLRDLPDDAFRRVVDQYLRDGARPEVIEALRGPLLERVLDQLLGMTRSVTAQMDAKDAELAALAADVRLGRVTQQSADEQTSAAMKWRASVIRFQERIEVAIIEHERLLRQTRVQELEQAIRTHRDARRNFDLSAPSLDLWAVLGDDA